MVSGESRLINILKYLNMSIHVQMNRFQQAYSPGRRGVASHRNHRVNVLCAEIHSPTPLAMDGLLLGMVCF